jgi:tetratricopeptide (TPR) repeat protein
MNYFDQLPSEINLMILDRLDVASFGRIRQTAIYWSQLATSILISSNKLAKLFNFNKKDDLIKAVHMWEKYYHNTSIKLDNTNYLSIKKYMSQILMAIKTYNYKKGIFLAQQFPFSTPNNIREFRPLVHDIMMELYYQYEDNLNKMSEASFRSLFFNGSNSIEKYAKKINDLKETIKIFVKTLKLDPNEWISIMLKNYIYFTPLDRSIWKFIAQHT